MPTARQDLDHPNELEAAFALQKHPNDTDDEVLSLLSSNSNEHDDNETLLPAHHRNQSMSSVFSLESIPMIPLSQSQVQGPELQKKLSFWNGLGFVIGSMIGSGLFSSPGKRVILFSTTRSFLVILSETDCIE